MPDDKKILVDDDWKAEARREKERLTQETKPPDAAGMPAEAGFPELLNILVMQAMVGLGLMAGPGGRPIPPNLELAKHFIDLLQVLEDKTKGNLSAEEKQLLDQVMYEMRMRYVQRAGGGPAPAPGPAA